MNLKKPGAELDLVLSTELKLQTKLSISDGKN